MQSYEELLKQAYEKLPKKDTGKDRFEVPQIEIIQQGNATIIKNLSAIAEKLRREPKDIVTFLARETGASGTINNKEAIFQSKLSQNILQQKLEQYIRKFVMCKECKRPDTSIIRENRILLVKCEACGARYSPDVV